MQNIAKQQELIQATDKCVMCGLCIPHCPTYLVASNEAESPRGRITLVRALLEDNLPANQTLVSHLDNCLTCLKCQSLCPANVEYEKIIDMGRELTVNNHTYLHRIKQSILLFTLSNPYARKFLQNTFKLLCISGITQLLKKATNRIPIFALLPSRIDSSFPQASIAKQNKTEKTIKVILMNSCANEMFSDNTKAAAEYLLKNLGCELVSLNQTLCCGALHQHSGNSQTATKFMQELTTLFANKNYDALVSLATGCGAYLNRYPQLLNTPAAKAVTSKHSNVNEFILQLLEKQHTMFKPLPATVLIHNPCTQKQINDDEKLIIKLLSKIPQIELHNFADGSGCCGAGGMNLINQADIAKQLMHKLVHTSINKDKPPVYLVSSNIGCTLHFKSYFEQQGIRTHVCHPITLLAQQLL